MFGLTRREQRWKAEQAVVETLMPLLVTIAEATAQARVAEAQAGADEVPKLRAEVAELRQLLARYRDEVPLGHQPHMTAHLADDALGRT